MSRASRKLKRQRQKQKQKTRNLNRTASSRPPSKFAKRFHTLRNMMAVTYGVIGCGGAVLGTVVLGFAMGAPLGFFGALFVGLTIAKCNEADDERLAAARVTQ